MKFRTTDVAINKTTDDDTGLYELYANVVRPFVDNMIVEAERYITEPTGNWVERGDSNWVKRGVGDGKTIAHGQGMSYCYGCKDSIAEFNSQVVNCQVQNTPAIIARENDANQANYRGNVGTRVAQENQPAQNCQVGAANQGAGQWAGLYAAELRRWSNNVAGEAPQAFNPSYWAGIDCAGFVQRVVGAAKDMTNGEKVTISSPTAWMYSQDIFLPNHVFYQDRVADLKAQVEQQKKLSRGDLIRYFVPNSVAHISIFYSNTVDGAGDYQIIHAFGARKSDHDNDKDTSPVFSRKVIVTGNKATTYISNPSGYGRIRLWD